MGTAKEFITCCRWMVIDICNSSFRQNHSGSVFIWRKNKGNAAFAATFSIWSKLGADIRILNIEKFATAKNCSISHSETDYTNCCISQFMLLFIFLMLGKNIQDVCCCSFVPIQQLLLHVTPYSISKIYIFQALKLTLSISNLHDEIIFFGKL